MGKKNKKQTIDYNSIYVPKVAPWVKRFAAWVVDIILIIVVASGIGLITSAISPYDDVYNEFYEKQIEYGVLVENSAGTDVTFNGKNYILCTNDSSLTKEETDARISALQQDPEFQKINEQRNILPVIITSTGIFGSLLIFEFILPLCLRHGRTLGMYFFGIGYVTDEDIDVGFKQVFVRFIFGKVIVNALVPYASVMYILYNTGYSLMGLLLIIAVLGANLGMLFGSRDKRTVPDYIARMKPIDNTCQIYFKTVDELGRAKAEEAKGKETVKKW